MAHRDPGQARGVGAERRRQRVDLRAPGDRREAPEDRAEPDREHDDRELRLADDSSEDRRVQGRAEDSNQHHRQRKRQPVADPVPDDEHVAGEGAQHQEIALREVHELGRFVDEHEAERHQPIDAAHREAVQHELQDDVQAALLRVGSEMLRL